MNAYLKNAWYAAAYSDEVSHKPLARTLLDEPLVLYRKESGEPVLMTDRCPHRFAPLSLGVIIGNDIQCPYHGLRFDSTGACSHNPHSSGPPPKNARLNSYPVHEQYGFIWFWPGDPQRADTSRLPDFNFLTDQKRFRVVKGLLHVKGNYQLIVDNLLDLSHAAFIHPQFSADGVSIEAKLAATTSKLERRGDTVYNYRVRTGLPAAGPSQKLFGYGPEEPVISRSHMTWYPPAILNFDLGSHVDGQSEEEGLCLPQAHCITPETEFTSHYFFANARNKRLEDASADEALLAMFDKAFRQQDEPMIEAVQQKMGTISDIHQLKPVFLSTDGAPVAARRLLTQLIQAEQNQLDLAAG